MARILQIIPSLNQINGGVERGTLDVAKELINIGFESCILSSGAKWRKNISIEVSSTMN